MSARDMTPKQIARFWSHVEPEPNTGCWLWSGHDVRGYGQFSLRGRTLMAHRVSYELYVGPIPAGLQIDHLCRMPPCVNPDHLEAVTGRVNTLRGNTITARHASQTHCLRGHPFDEHNTLMVHGRKHRQCRKCQAYRDAVRWIRIKAERDGERVA